MPEPLQSNQFILVVTTEKDIAKAKSMARSLLNKKFAACISFKEVRSIYWWENSLEESNEVQLQIKTSKDKFNLLLKEVKSLHSYDLPEIISWSASCDKEYANWLNQSLLDY